MVELIVFFIFSGFYVYNKIVGQMYFKYALTLATPMRRRYSTATPAFPAKSPDARRASHYYKLARPTGGTWNGDTRRPPRAGHRPRLARPRVVERTAAGSTRAGTGSRSTSPTAVPLMAFRLRRADPAGAANTAKTTTNNAPATPLMVGSDVSHDRRPAPYAGARCRRFPPCAPGPFLP